jgi:hypothetical protein
MSEPELPPRSNRDLYVTGLGRSGTTVATVLLNLHPECRLTYESSMVVDFLQAFAPNCGRTPGYHIWTTWEGGCTTRYSWALNHALQGWREVQVVTPEAAARECVEALWRCWGSPPVFGDKSPMYSEVAWRDKVRSVLPDVRYIVLDRPVEECIESWVSRWHRGPREEAEAFMHRRIKELKLMTEPHIRMELAHLQAEPVEAVKAMLEFAGLDSERYPFERAVEIVNGPKVN